MQVHGGIWTPDAIERKARTINEAWVRLIQDVVARVKKGELSQAQLRQTADDFQEWTDVYETVKKSFTAKLWGSTVDLLELWERRYKAAYRRVGGSEAAPAPDLVQQPDRWAQLSGTVVALGALGVLAWALLR